MTEREDVIRILQNITNFFEEKGVKKLIQEKKIKELEELGKQADFSSVNDFFSNPRNELGMGATTIKGDCVVVAYVIRLCGCGDYRIFENYYDFQELLKNQGGEIGKRIAGKMPHAYLNQLSLEEFCN